MILAYFKAYIAQMESLSEFGTHHSVTPIMNNNNNNKS